MKGSVHAIKEFLDRTEGKVTNKFEHTGQLKHKTDLDDFELIKQAQFIIERARQNQIAQAEKED